MIIGLVSSLNIDNNIEYNVEQIRNYSEHADGGCYVFFNGKVVHALPMRKMGILEFEV